MESRLYTGVLEAFVQEYNPSPCAIARYEGLAEASRKYTATHPEAPGTVVADTAAPSEALIDMFSRLHALGMQD